MQPIIKIFADFNNADEQGRIRLNTNGTYADLKEMQLKLEPGLEILLSDDDSLMASGIVQYSEEEQIWVAIINWDEI